MLNVGRLVGQPMLLAWALSFTKRLDNRRPFPSTINMGIHPHYPHGTPIISTDQSRSKHIFFLVTMRKGSKHIWNFGFLYLIALTVFLITNCLNFQMKLHYHISIIILRNTSIVYASSTSLQVNISISPWKTNMANINIFLYI